METSVIYYAILGMGLISIAVKAAPIMLLARRRLSSSVLEVGRFLPIAVLSAMAVSGVFAPGGRLELGAENVFLAAALPTLVVAVVTRQMLLTIVVGILATALARWLLF